jgi:pSer/pThr/pTyr-binding forkhead associated (FHA) protein
MPPFVLTVLKVVFLLFLYFFVYRAIKSSAADLRAARVRPAAGPARARAPEPARAAGKGGKAPRTVVVIDDKGSKLATHTLNGQLQIGRADACQIQLGDNYASQFHARIYSRDGGWFVEDLGSTNGTYVNQRRITAPAEVRAGDKIRIGKTTLELKR